MYWFFFFFIYYSSLNRVLFIVLHKGAHSPTIEWNVVRCSFKIIVSSLSLFWFSMLKMKSPNFEFVECLHNYIFFVLTVSSTDVLISLEMANSPQIFVLSIDKIMIAATVARRPSHRHVQMINMQIDHQHRSVRVSGISSIIWFYSNCLPTHYGLCLNLTLFVQKSQVIYWL